MEANGFLRAFGLVICRDPGFVWPFGCEAHEKLCIPVGGYPHLTKN